MAPTSTAIYARISDDKAGEGLGVARQERMCRELAERKGWPVGEVFADNSISASSGKRRPAYERMLQALRDGTHDALLCVDVDRLTRRPVELEELIDLAERHGVALANVSGDLDLATPDGRLKARIMGAVARQEIERKSERQARANEDAARRGVFVASRQVFGWRKGSLEQEPNEAAMIRDAAAQVLAGANLTTIRDAWNGAGVTTPYGGKWTTTNLRLVLDNPRHAGLQVYKGEIVGPGAWEPILDRGTWQRLQAWGKRRRRTGRPRTFLLSGILRCGHCGAGLNGGTNNGQPAYGCRKCFKIDVKAADVDELIVEQVLRALEQREIVPASEDGRDLTAALVRDEALLEELAQDRADGVMSRAEWLRAREVVQQRIDATTRDLERSTAPRIPADPRAWWAGASVDQQRALLAVLIDRIEVAPHDGRRRKDGRVAFDSSRLRAILADDAAPNSCD